jgi:two-component system, NtrC family, response regulator AtoC
VADIEIMQSASVLTMQSASVVVVADGPGSCDRQPGANGQIIARSAAMREVLDRVCQVAGTAIPVLLHGEIGVGKRAIAREIHRRSRYAAGPFVRIVCGALRDSELEKKLCGESGDPFQADAGRTAEILGLESGQLGTLFLDGVSQLPVWAQIKLLDALQESVGQSREDKALIPTQLRVIASTTCDLESTVVQNRFDSRLYYYLHAVRIDVPPLRHRQEDVLALADYFLAAAVSEFCPPRHTPPRYFSEEAWQCLLRYDWPGNVLQLAAVVAHAAMLAEGPEIGQACVAGLLDSVRQHPDSETISVPLTGGLREMEQIIVNEIIRRCRGNKAAAARALKLHRRTLYRLLEK